MPPTLWQRFCEVLFCFSMSMSLRTKWGPNDLPSGVKVLACTKLRSEPHWTLLGVFGMLSQTPIGQHQCLTFWCSLVWMASNLYRYVSTSSWRPIQWSCYSRKETSNFLLMPMVLFDKHMGVVFRCPQSFDHILQIVPIKGIVHTKMKILSSF